MIRTVIAAGLIGLPLVTAAPALAHSGTTSTISSPGTGSNGPTSSVSCSSPCTIVGQTIANYAALPGQTIANYAALPGETITNYALLPLRTLSSLFPGASQLQSLLGRH